MINIFGLTLFIFNYFTYDYSVRGLLQRALSVLVLKGQYHGFFFLPRIATSSWHSPLKLSKLVPKIKRVQILLRKEAATTMMLSIDRNPFDVALNSTHNNGQLFHESARWPDTCRPYVPRWPYYISYPVRGGGKIVLLKTPNALQYQWLILTA